MKQQINETDLDDQNISQRLETFFKYCVLAVVVSIVVCILVVVGVLRGLGYQPGTVAPSPAIHEAQSPESAIRSGGD